MDRTFLSKALECYEEAMALQPVTSISTWASCLFALAITEPNPEKVGCVDCLIVVEGCWMGSISISIYSCFCLYFVFFFRLS
jgi:hypothetical protein